MFFLGIDPGLSEVGFGVVEVKDREPVFVDCGIIKTLPTSSLGERLSIIKTDLLHILEMHKYSAVGLEELLPTASRLPMLAG
jgi:Holliday junction resolvasome RuvABC endonuclease subunit